MPSSPNYVRDYTQERKTESPKRKQDRAARNRARLIVEKASGPLPGGVDVDHKRPLSKGGSNLRSNLRPQKASANRSFARTSSGRMRGK